MRNLFATAPDLSIYLSRMRLRTRAVVVHYDPGSPQVGPATGGPSLLLELVRHFSAFAPLAPR